MLLLCQTLYDLPANGVFRRSWSLHSIWNSPSRTHRLALLREGQSRLLPGEGREEDDQDVLVGFYTTLNLEVGRQYVTCGLEGGALEPRGGALPHYP
jgi:hypothetical protein